VQAAFFFRIRGRAFAESRLQLITSDGVRQIVRVLAEKFREQRRIREQKLGQIA
jgi:hypothetical protein